MSALAATSPAATLRVVIAAEVPLLAAGLRATLEAAGHRVQAAVPTACLALRALAAHPADVLVAAVELQDANGFALVHAARARHPGLSCLLLSEAPDEEELYRAIKLGAGALLCVTCRPDALLAVLPRVAAGEAVLTTDVLLPPPLHRPAPPRTHPTGRPANAPVIDYIPLSKRELEVVSCIGRGQGNKRIAAALKISDQTVKNHITAILRKLGVDDRTHAAIYCLVRGWISIEEGQK